MNKESNGLDYESLETQTLLDSIADLRQKADDLERIVEDRERQNRPDPRFANRYYFFHSDD